MNSVAELTIRETEVPTSIRVPLRLVWLGPNVSRLVHASAPEEYSPSAACRLFNIVVAGIALVILAPLMLAIAAIVKLTSTGPVIYTQSRVGVDRRGGEAGKWAERRKVDYGGRLFTIYKFRTMRPSEKATLQVWATPDDGRVTPIGRILREYRLDELPQLFNVLKGDMNIVGPRPEQPKIFANLREQVDSYSVRQRVLPGITGLAQINQSYDTSLDDVREKVRYDLEYINRQSVLEDLRILLGTVPVILGRRGAW